MARKTRCCLNPHCCREVRARGLCGSCYVRAQQLVAGGKTTWNKLVKAGRALESNRKNGTTAWLLGRS